MKIKGYKFILLALIYQVLSIECATAQANDEDSLFISEELTEQGLFTGGIEGPAVDKRGNIYAVNYQKEGTIGKVTPEGSCTLFVTLPEGSIGNGIRFNKEGEMFVADYPKHNILKVNMETKEIEVYAHEDDMNQPNDLAISDNGVLYASDPNWGENSGNIWRIDTNRTVHLLESNMGTTNGIEVSPDNRTLYVGESNQHRILAYDLSSDGEISNKRVFKEFEDEVFDGMRCDSIGNLYATCYNKGKVYILSPDGEVKKVVTLIGNTVSNICFGGADGRACYVTMVDKKNIETFRTDVPGRSWVMQQEITSLKNRRRPGIPKKVLLKQNYPNPFNPQTSIPFIIQQSGFTSLSVYNMLGQKVSVLVNSELSSGSYTYKFIADNLPSGQYFYRLKSGDFIEEKEMILIK